MADGDGAQARPDDGRPDDGAPLWASPPVPASYVPVFGPDPDAGRAYAYGPEPVDVTPGAPPVVQPLPADPPRRSRGGGSVILLAAGVALVTGLAGGFAGGWLAGGARERVVRDPSFTLPAPSAGTTQRSAGTVPAVANRVLPSVVALRVSGGGQEGTGSGFVIEGGYILTNNHVVSAAAGGGGITVVFQDGSQAKGSIVGRDPSYDLAVVKADTDGRTPLPLGDSDGVVVGDSVIAVGAPLGLQGTVTTGIVSARNRPVVAGDEGETAFINAIQTDAAINPGNSGGPLVDATGRVIGINSAIARAPGSGAGQAGNIGLGFAIPSNQARRTAEELVRTGRSSHPVVGVLLDETYTGPGVRVATGPRAGQPAVTPGGPAARAGIRPGDVVLAVDGVPVAAPEELVVQVRAKAVGDSAVLTVRRDGRTQEVTVRLAASQQ
jgi:putative serine protease PepD